MKGKTTKRIIAWIMSVCMIAGILPVTPYEYTARAKVVENSPIVYDFSGLVSSNYNLVLGNGVTANNTPLNISAEVKAPYGDYDKISVLKPDSAKYYLSDAAVTLNNISTAEPARSNIMLSSTGFYMTLRRKAQTYVDVKIKVEEAGEYDISSDIWLGVGTSTAPTATITFVGEDITMATSAAADDSVSVGSAYLEAKEYTVRYSLEGRATTDGPSTTVYLYARSLTLVKKPDVQPTAYDFSGKVTGATGDKTLWCSYDKVDNSSIYNTFTYANATAKGSLPWMYFAKSSSNNSRNYWSMNANSLYVRSNSGRNTTLTLKIKAPETGYYELTPEYWITIGSEKEGDAATHGAWLELLENDGVTSKLKLFEKTSTGGFTTKSMGVTYLEKDKEYTLKVAIYAGNSAGNGNYLYLKSITLAPKKPVIVTPSVTSVEAAAGETKSVTITANHGEDPLDLTAEGVEVKCEVTQGAAEVSYDAGAVTVKPTKNGINKVKATVSYDGMSGSCEVTFYSLPDDDGAESYVYDFNKSKPDGYTGSLLLQNIPELQSYANSLLKGSAPWMYHSGGEQYEGDSIWTYEMGSAYAFTIRQRVAGVPALRRCVHCIGKYL